jgi:DNA-binding transcriptional MerR regulator
MLTVKAAAALAGVSVRTLHHYEALGLIRPARTDGAGYRLYGPDDLARLQQVLFFRELGFELKAIAPILDDPAFDRARALKTHRTFIEAEARRLQTLLTTLDRTIESIDKETPMEAKHMFDGFDEQERAQLAAWQEEARERWGQTDAYRQSAQRTAGYTKADWDRIKAEAKAIDDAFAALMDRDPADPAVQALVERNRAHIHQFYYDCSPAFMKGLADMWVNDPRFTKNIDKTAPGLAAFKHAAVQVYAGESVG